METLAWKEFCSFPCSLRVRGEITFHHGPDRADIHRPVQEASVDYILSSVPAFDSIRIYDVDSSERSRARLKGGEE